MSRKKKPFEDTAASACEAAARFLARREHGRRELAFKLARKGYNDGVLTAALDELVARDWLNERRYAESVARHRCAQGRGPRWVEAELESQGVGEADIAAALAQQELDWTEACAQALRRLSADDPEPKRRHKLYQRGFLPEHIDAALKSS